MTGFVERRPGRRWVRCFAGLAVAALAGCSSNVKLSPNSVELLPPPVAKPGPDYRLQLGNTLHVSFVYQPENDVDLVVRPDGRISLSPAGELEAVGRTEGELEQAITERAAEHLREPTVIVALTKVVASTSTSWVRSSIPVSRASFPA